MSFARRFDEPVRLGCRRALDGDALLAVLEDEGAGRRVAVADLSLGPSQAFQAAQELCLQLGVVVLAPMLVRARAADPAEDSLGGWIDGEGRGDFAAISGHALAGRVVDALAAAPPTAIIVLAPWPGEDWGADNAQFLKFLALGLRDSEHRLVVVATRAGSPPALPAPIELEVAPEAGAPTARGAARRDGMFAAVPGLIPADLVQRIDPELLTEGLMPLDGGLMLVAPEDRAAADLVPADVLAALAEASAATSSAPGWRWCRAFALAHLPVTAATASEIRSTAWELVGGGGFDAARRLLIASSVRADAALAGELVVEHQRMAIASQRFDLAAGAADPDTAMAAGQRRDIRYGKGWGCIMTGDAAGAQHQFDLAGPPDPAAARGVADLYMLNIYALVRFRNGDTDGALRLERAVEAALGECEHAPLHLRYINCLNLARLVRAGGDLAGAERYFRQGFATLDGLRGETDQIFINVALARLATAGGRAEEGRQAMLRACLHWLAMPVPEALGWRTARSLLPPEHARRVVPGLALTLELVAEVSGVLAAELALAEQRAGRAIPDATAATPAFGHATDIVPYTPATPVVIRAAAGWAAVDYAPVQQMRRACIDAPTDRLGAMVHAVLARDLGGSGFAGAILLDPRAGRDIATTAADVLECAWRWRAEEIQYGTNRIACDDAFLDQAIMHATVGPSFAIENVTVMDDKAMVMFRRHRPPTRLTARQVGASVVLNAAARVSERLQVLKCCMSWHDIQDALRSLDAAGLLAWDFTASAVRLGLVG